MNGGWDVAVRTKSFHGGRVVNDRGDDLRALHAPKDGQGALVVSTHGVSVDHHGK